MKLKKESVEIDLAVDNKRMTEKEKNEFSEFIKEYKRKNSSTKKRVSKAA